MIDLSKIDRISLTDIAVADRRTHLPVGSFVGKDGGIKKQFLRNAKNSKIINYKDFQKSVRNIENKYGHLTTKQINNRIKKAFDNNATYNMAQNMRQDASLKAVYAVWLPSTAVNPDEVHATYYNRKFKLTDGIGGELPAERYGCQCGIAILKDGTPRTQKKIIESAVNGSGTSLVLGITAGVLTTATNKKVGKTKAEEIVTNIDNQAKIMIPAVASGYKLDDEAVEIKIEYEIKEQINNIYITTKLDNNIQVINNKLYIRQSRLDKLANRAKQLLIKDGYKGVDILTVGGIEL